MAPAGNQPNRRSGSHIFLPGDLMFEIMVRLPVKSILRFKPLSKFWYNFLEDFIRNHLEHHVNDPPRLLVVHAHNDKTLNRDDQLCFSNLLDESLDNLDYPPEFPFQFREVIGTVNGLFLLKGGIDPGQRNRAAIFNPATKQYKEIRAPICTKQRGTHGRPFDINFGFGFDSRTNDFKVIAFPDPESTGWKLLFHVYSLANDSWTNSPIHHGISARDGSELQGHTHGSTYFNSTLHWLFSNLEDYYSATFSVLSFDVRNETFDVFAGPENHTVKNPFFFSRQYGNRSDDYLLSTLFYWPLPDDELDSWVPDHSMDLMVMKDKGCWEKHLSIDISDMAQPMDHLGLWKDNRVLLKTSTNEVMFYDTDTNEFQELGRIDKTAHIVEIYYYKASLVSVKGGTNKQKAAPM